MVAPVHGLRRGSEKKGRRRSPGVSSWPVLGGAMAKWGRWRIPTEAVGGASTMRRLWHGGDESGHGWVEVRSGHPFYRVGVWGSEGIEERGGRRWWWEYLKLWLLGKCERGGVRWRGGSVLAARLHNREARQGMVVLGTPATSRVGGDAVVRWKTTSVMGPWWACSAVWVWRRIGPMQKKEIKAGWGLGWAMEE
jgi:hypothetical protein